ncbi:MAG: NAD(P)(+) transhydrogenase (Re/Si-specific) subunit beta [Gemmatimonadales bacterium]|uniref:NAD(P)(+) transhydrogenase (Re/Si-specific) subunit beta n=1 Tax=Candidatus Palauibacter TaxID=3056650 RepID=UPI001381AAF9|nr:NAD(P)(+) transhydrogenase (Re/Si-specific) subunit beta [Candidatus Palauibacter irciniicola]MYC19734.1 NAD(P)(+) transhydrogenase (Re/Si-specific) subunit beta [Gemmatimonadales bacterium]
MSGFSTAIPLAYLASAVLFILGIKRLSHPDTAAGGNRLAAIGMLLAVIATLLESGLEYTWIIAGVAIGGLIGGVMARTVKMTAMPEMVAVFNGFGGAASGLVAVGEYLRVAGGAGGETLAIDSGVSIMAGTLIGAVTFSGSMIAFGKLQGFVTGNAISNPLVKFSAGLLLGVAVVLAVYLVGFESNLAFYWGLIAAALILGVLFVIPIGGADMPVVVALLNSYSGLAAASAGFVLGNNALIISGALVGASGLILTGIMCRAMNRSLANVLFSAFGTGSATAGRAADGDRVATPIEAEDSAMVLGYASQVIFVPGYGLAVAQAQHRVRELADLLTERGVSVRYCVHPVAGRMPGHMNVLLAEANVPYEQLCEPEDVNPDMENIDVAVVVGANDVVNPLARDDPSSPIGGMPIIETDRAKTCIVIKRSLSVGYAGIDNPLFYLRNNRMFFGDASDALARITEEVKQL